jgi:hypothetical protein
MMKKLLLLMIACFGMVGVGSATSYTYNMFSISAWSTDTSPYIIIWNTNSSAMTLYQFELPYYRELYKARIRTIYSHTWLYITSWFMNLSGAWWLVNPNFNMLPNTSYKLQFSHTGDWNVWYWCSVSASPFATLSVYQSWALYVSSHTFMGCTVGKYGWVTSIILSGTIYWPPTLPTIHYNWLTGSFAGTDLYLIGNYVFSTSGADYIYTAQTYRTLLRYH